MFVSLEKCRFKLLMHLYKLPHSANGAHTFLTFQSGNHSLTHCWNERKRIAVQDTGLQGNFAKFNTTKEETLVY